MGAATPRARAVRDLACGERLTGGLAVGPDAHDTANVALFAAFGGSGWAKTCQIALFPSSTSVFDETRPKIRSLVPYALA